MIKPELIIASGKIYVTLSSVNIQQNTLFYDRGGSHSLELVFFSDDGSNIVSRLSSCI